jgi:peroxiredoxin Q/BCP
MTHGRSMRSCLAAGLLACAALAADAGSADEVTLDVGDEAPAFVEHDDQGNIWSSADHVGKKVLVVYFFPAALTGG